MTRQFEFKVLAVGNLYPLRVDYSYVISKTSEEIFEWRTLPRWAHCDKICQGKQLSQPVCVKVQPGYEAEVEVSRMIGSRGSNPASF